MRGNSGSSVVLDGCLDWQQVPFFHSLSPPACDECNRMLLLDACHASDVVCVVGKEHVLWIMTSTSPIDTYKALNMTTPVLSCRACIFTRKWRCCMSFVL
jgi:hypothetical protein